MRRPSARTGWLRVVMLTAFLLLMTSCQTSPRTIPSIDIQWPAFPDPEGSVVYVPEEECDFPGGLVVMPLSYWLALGRYVVDVERVRKQIEAMYGGE